jgi:uncharacterized protein
LRLWLPFVLTVLPTCRLKGTIAVWDGTHLVFADIRSPGTVANLKVNPTIEINVVDPFLRKGYRFKGTAELVTGGDLFRRCSISIALVGLTQRGHDRRRQFELSF